MTRTWLDALFTRSNRAARVRRQPLRLAIEALEDRLVPAQVTFNTGSLIIPMDTAANGQNNGMLRAYGLAYDLLRNDVPVQGVINPFKAANGDDMTVTGTLQDVESGAPLGSSRTYRGGPFVIAASDAAAALPIIQAWQAIPGDDTTVHRLTSGSFTTDVARTLLHAPRVAVLLDGNEQIAFNDLNAAGIPDADGGPWGPASPDLLTEAQVVGGPAVADGALFNANGTPRYSDLMAMHYISTPLTPAVVQEVRAWLDRGPLTHAFMECSSAIVFENDAGGRFLTTNGIRDDGSAATTVANRTPANPLSQIDGTFTADTGAVDSIGLAGGLFKTGVTTLFNENSASLTQRITMLTGRLDGSADNGRVTYLAGHDYTLDLPITSNPQTNGVRLILNSLFATDSVTAPIAQADVVLTQSAPALINSSQFTITLSYANAGLLAAENVTLRAAVPTGASFVSATGGGTVSGSVVTWNLGTLAAGASGSQSFTVAVTSDGFYTTRPASILFSDLTVNQALSNTSVTFRDTVPPLVTIVSGPSGATSDNTPIFAFVPSLDAVTTECRIDGGPFVTSTSPFTAPFPLTDGDHTFQVRATDLAGNIATFSRTFAVDTVVPVVTVPGPPINPVVTGDNTPTFVFSVDSPANTQAVIHSGPVVVASVPGTSPFTVPFPLTDGVYVLEVRATDAAGNVGLAFRVFVVDTVAPTVAIVNGPSGATNDNTPTFAFVPSPDAVTSECRIDGDPFVTSTSPFTAPFPLTDGDHTFQVLATDAAGNVATASRTFTVDTMAPVVTIPGWPINLIITSDSTPTFFFFVDSSANTQAVIHSGPVVVASVPSTSPFTVPFPLTDGVYVLEVRATDAAGTVGVAYHTFIVDSTMTVTLTSIEVQPASSTVAAGLTNQFTAVGTFSDGLQLDLTSSVTWASSDPTIATVSNATGSKGLAVGVGVGVSQISASQNGVLGTTILSVTEATLISIDVTPINSTVAAGLTRQFNALGTFSDGTHQDLTSSVIWSSSNRTVAAVSNATGSRGLATGLAAGVSQISASQNGVLGTTILSVTEATLISIDVTPIDSTVAAGLTKQFNAVGTFSDGSHQDLTNSVTWSSSNRTVATVSNATGSRGLATGLAASVSQISASQNGVLGTTILSVTEATLTSIDVTPINSTVAAGLTRQFNALGNFSDGTHQDLTSSVTWSSSNRTVAAVSNATGSRGLATGLAVGLSQISAQRDGVLGTTILTVTEATLISIDVTPINSTVAAGLTRQFNAVGTFSDGSHQDLTSSVTWASSNRTVATVSNATGSKGLATGVAVGVSEITAQRDGVLGTTTLLVGNASSLTMNFNNTAIQAGNYVWFSSVIKPSGLSSTETTTVWFVNQTITIGAVVVPVPNASITYHPGTGTSTTVFTSAGWWQTDVYLGSGLSGNQFLSGLGYYLPGGLSGGTKDVSWSGVFFTDHTGVSLNWKWAAAVYTQLPYLGSQVSSVDYNAMAIKPVDDNKSSAYQNSDHAGTPEGMLANGSPIKSRVTGGATGGGGSNYTGGYSGTKTASPTSAIDEFFIELGWMEL